MRGHHDLENGAHHPQRAAFALDSPRDYVAEPLIAPLLRVPLQAIRERIREEVAAAGYDDLGPAHFNILQAPLRTASGPPISRRAVR